MLSTVEALGLEHGSLEHDGIKVKKDPSKISSEDLEQHLSTDMKVRRRKRKKGPKCLLVSGRLTLLLWLL